MGALSFLQQAVGNRGDASSATGSAHAKLAQLLAYIPNDSPYNGTQQVPQYYPTFTTEADVPTSASPWTLGVWTQIVAAATLSAHVLVGNSIGTAQGCRWGAEIGQGAIGSEVVIWRHYGTTWTQVGEVAERMPPRAVYIPANARVAVRWGNSLGGSTLGVYLGFAPRPL